MANDTMKNHYTHTLSVLEIYHYSAWFKKKKKRLTFTDRNDLTSQCGDHYYNTAYGPRGNYSLWQIALIMWIFQRSYQFLNMLAFFLRLALSASHHRSASSSKTSVSLPVRWRQRKLQPISKKKQNNKKHRCRLFRELAVSVRLAECGVKCMGVGSPWRPSPMVQYAGVGGCLLIVR